MKDPTRWQEILIQSGSDKLTKQDVYDYYTNPKIQKHLLNATGKNEVILRQSFTPENVVLRRKSESGAPIFLRGKSDLQTWAEKRLTEVHPTYGHKTDHLLVDLDPGEDVSWTKVQQTAKQVAQTLGADPSVTGVSAQFSGHRGFYVRGQLDRDMNIDAAREKVKGLLAGLTQQDKSLTLGIKSDPQRQIRLDTTPLKYRGSVKAPYSLSAETGLVAAPVQIDDLTKVKPGDFTIGQIVKTAIDLEGLRSTWKKLVAPKLIRAEKGYAKPFAQAEIELPYARRLPQETSQGALIEKIGPHANSEFPDKIFIGGKDNNLAKEMGVDLSPKELEAADRLTGLHEADEIEWQGKGIRGEIFRPFVRNHFTPISHGDPIEAMIREGNRLSSLPPELQRVRDLRIQRRMDTTDVPFLNKIWDWMGGNYHYGQTRLSPAARKHIHRRVNEELAAHKQKIKEMSEQYNSTMQQNVKKAAEKMTGIRYDKNPISLLTPKAKELAGRLDPEWEATKRDPEKWRTAIEPFMKVKEAAELLSKEARLSMSKLQGMLKGEPALFHMVNPENVPNFLQSKKLMSPLEAKTRGLVSNLEGGAGVERVPTSEFNKTRTPIRLGEHSARIDARNLVSGNSEPAAQLTRMSAPGVTGKYHRVMQENRNMSGSGAGKNWSSISFDTVPRRAYGDVGMMTSPSQIRGSLVGESYTRGPRTPESLTEVQAHPSWVSRKGLTHHMTLPQATGNIVYDPQAVSREAAKQLKAQGGVPLNARFRRLSKAYQKQNLQNMPAGALQDIEAGNVNTATTMPQWHQKTVARAAQRVPLRKSWKKPTPIEQVKTSAAKLYRDRVEVFARTPDGKILAGLYSGSAKNVAVPGGGIEKGETKAQAGKREFREEAGIAVRRIRELGVAPVLTAWAKKDKSYKGKDWQADIKKHPKGNRTHFVLADIDTAKPKQKPRDPTEFHKTLKARPINDLIEIQRKAIQSHSGSDRLKQMRKRLEMLLKIKHAEKTAFDYGGLFRVADVLDDQLWLYLLKKHQQAKETPVEAPSYSMTPGPGPANYAAPPPFAEEPRSMFRKESAQKEFAPGIPLSRKIHDVPKVRDKAWTLAVQRHFADKAGKHFDLRLVDPSTGRAHSFAMPKAELPKPGQMRLAIQQATHTSDYALNFEGKIPKGTYGSGKVEMALKKPVDIIKANANKILFKTKDGDSYSMFRMKDKNWGIRNTTK